MPWLTEEDLSFVLSFEVRLVINDNIHIELESKIFLLPSRLTLCRHVTNYVIFSSSHLGSSITAWEHLIYTYRSLSKEVLFQP